MNNKRHFCLFTLSHEYVVCRVDSLGHLLCLVPATAQYVLDAVDELWRNMIVT